MTDKEIEEELKYLRSLCEALLRVQWHERGVMKGVATNLDSIRGKVESELDPYFQDWLKRKSEVAETK